MKNRNQYILFVVVVLLVQVLLLNNLTFSPYVAPLAYIVLIIMTPLGTSPLKMIFVGLMVGTLMDITMGTVGINVLATMSWLWSYYTAYSFSALNTLLRPILAI